MKQQTECDERQVVGIKLTDVTRNVLWRAGCLTAQHECPESGQ
jgi:hypothetical protein